MRWEAAPAGAGRNVIVRSADSRQTGAVADVHVPADARLPTDGHEIADPRRAGDADLRDDDAMASDLDVVAYLDLIVDFRALAYHRVPVGAAVDGGVGADLHIVLNDDA